MATATAIRPTTRSPLSVTTGVSARPVTAHALVVELRPVAAEHVARPTLAPVEGAPPVHLTRRGRLLVVAALVALLLAAFSLGRTATGAAAPQVAAAPTVEQTTVAPGDTLWAVARRIAPESDPRVVVDQIRRINGLQSVELRAGQQLLLPVAA